MAGPDGPWIDEAFREEGRLGDGCVKSWGIIEGAETVTSSRFFRLNQQSPAQRQGDPRPWCRAVSEGLDLGVFLGPQLAEIWLRFPAHVEDIREFLLKEKLPVPSPDAIPELASRMGTDPRFCADVSSLLRVALYREREQVGYEDLLGILVAAAAGTEQDLKSDSQETCMREMLRLLLQSRRSTFRPEAEESTVEEASDGPVEAEPRASVPIAAEAVHPEPVLRVRAAQSTANSMKLELRPDEPAVAVAEPDSCESGERESGDLVLRPLATGELFAAQGRSEDSWLRGHSVWIVGVVCMLLGVGIGLLFHRVVSAAETHVAVRAEGNS
jgi:hypothetical protein